MDNAVRTRGCLRSLEKVTAFRLLLHRLSCWRRGVDSFLLGVLRSMLFYHLLSVAHGLCCFKAPLSSIGQRHVSRRLERIYESDRVCSRGRTGCPEWGIRVEHFVRRLTCLSSRRLFPHKASALARDRWELAVKKVVKVGFVLTCRPRASFAPESRRNLAKCAVGAARAFACRITPAVSFAATKAESSDS